MSRFDRLEFREPEQTLGARGQQQQRADLRQPLDEDFDEGHWLRMAGDERRRGLHESALRYYSRALELDKSLVAGWVGQVQMLIALGEYPEAELWSRKALELFKNNAELLAGRAQALCRAGDLRAAQASCDAAIGQQGMFACPWIARGELMVARKDALDDYCFDKAAQIDPDWLVPLEIGAIYQHYGRDAKALTRTRQAVERAPDQAYCWYRQGACELALGLTAPAERSFARCLQLVPNHADAHRALADLKNNRRVLLRFFRRLFNWS
ncbi:MAG TPA: tetratricopeptide repeat protein [Tepidisphaeraceae bacterium]|jgi:tetratricopeptide (TPR) repeat protein